MSETAVENSLERIGDDDVVRMESRKICILGLLGATTDDPELETVRLEALDALRIEWRTRRAAWKCTIGGCGVTVTDDVEKGRTIRGECKASNFCLKATFEASSDESRSRDERSDLYRSIMFTCAGAADNYNAGNFCPKIDCELSAGFSIDGNAGTAGECVVEVRRPQQSLELTT
jgi:hypothetical protein